MILSFINICKVPREASPSVFNTSLGTLRMLMNGKIMFDPSNHTRTLHIQDLRWSFLLLRDEQSTFALISELHKVSISHFGQNSSSCAVIIG